MTRILIVIGIFFLLLSCTKEEEIIINPNEYLIGSWDVFSKLEWLAFDTLPQSFEDSFIFDFEEDHLLLIRRKGRRHSQDSVFETEYWAYTHWWIDERTNELVYAEPLYFLDVGTPYDIEYDNAYGELQRYSFNELGQNKMILQKAIYFDVFDDFLIRDYVFKRIE